MENDTRYGWIDDLEEIIGGAGGAGQNDAKVAVDFLTEWSSFIVKLIEEVKYLLEELGIG